MPPGRPPSGIQTRQIRAPEDIAEMLSDVIEIEGGTVAQLVDELIRKPLERRHAPLVERIEIIKAAKAGPLAPVLGGES